MEKDVTVEDLANDFARLTKCTYEVITTNVPEKKWIKKNGRVVSKGTKELFEQRARQYSAKEPTAKERKRWNRKIRNSCRNDYRGWVSAWVQKIEMTDNKGTLRQYRGVKAL